MDDMNQTQDPTAGAAEGTAPNSGEHPDESPRNQGPRVTRDQVFDIDRLRRSSSDKYLAGVSGGLGRHLDIDPLIVRVVFAVTALFGVGILLYGALWLLLPDDASNSAPVDTTPETRKVLVILAGVLAAAMMVGAVFGGTWDVFPLALLVLVGVGVYAAVRNKDPKPASTDPAAYHPDYYRPPGTPGAPGGPEDPTAWTYAPAPHPRRPRRTGPILFWPTLAVLAIALGSLAIWDVDHSVAPGSYPALALGIIGAALVIGAFVGRAGGLILLGLLTLPPLLVTSAVGNDFTRSTGSVNERPALAADVRTQYDVNSGSLHLDLTELNAAQWAALSGRQIDIDMSAGEVFVTLPTGVGYDAEATLRLAGEIRMGGRVSNGINPVLNNAVSARPGEPTIDLDIEGAVGRIEILQEGVIR